MGLFIRKSFKLGPFGRLNLSKSGLGLSVGVKGARVGVRPNGRSYVYGGRYGLYYRKELGKLGGKIKDKNIEELKISGIGPTIKLLKLGRRQMKSFNNEILPKLLSDVYKESDGDQIDQLLFKRAILMYLSVDSDKFWDRLDKKSDQGAVLEDMFSELYKMNPKIDLHVEATVD